MQAILHGKVDSSKSSGRGTPPKSVAAKYSSPGKDAPEQSGEDRGGSWGEKHHAKAKAKVKEDRKSRKKSKKDLRKSLEAYYKGKAAATIVLDDNNRILLGNHVNGGLAFPGGHMDPADQGDFAVTALRELREEAGLIGINPHKIFEGKSEGNETRVFLVEAYKGKLKSSEELKNIRWYETSEIPWDKLRDCCKAPMKMLIEDKMGKSLQGMLAIEALQKNIIRQKSSAVFEMSHGDSLKLVGNGLFRKLNREVKSMTDEDFKDIHIDTYTVSVRKHMNDVYSGRVSDGHKVVYQFVNKSLPEMTAALMSVFEWYMPEDEKLFDILDEQNLPDDAIEGGINELADNYKRHNIGNIYQEMETIREQMRNGMAVDLQQVEARIMKLFDKLEDVVGTITEKHNKLTQDVGSEMDQLEMKLRELQSKVEEMERRPEKVEAYSSNPPNKDEIINNFYPYLTKPKIEILPNGKITIMFESDWQHLEKENFLKDMRARVINKAGRKDG